MSLGRGAMTKLAAATGRVAWARDSASTRFRLWLWGARVGAGLRVRGKVRLYVHPEGKLVVGEHCRLRSGWTENAVGSSHQMCLWVGPGAALTLGSRLAASSATIVCTRRVEIGRDVYLGGGCGIYDSDFHSLDASQRLSSPDSHVRFAPVRIGDRAFIGAHALVLKGVVVGDEAVIGAGAVVTRAVAAREIWAGNPARRVGILSGSRR